LFFNPDSDYAITKIQESHKRQSKGTHQLLVTAGGGNLLIRKVNTIKNNTGRQGLRRRFMYT